MKRNWVAVGIILLFMGASNVPSAGKMMGEDDTTPPVTTINLNPPEPDGKNGWYVSKVTATLNATDDESGIKRTEYQLDYGPWQTYTHPFNITIDCHHILLYRSIDNAGNIEPSKNVTVKIDRTKPQLEIWYNFTGGNPQDGFDIIFYATAIDDMSGMNRTELYLNNVLQETIVGPGPAYEWNYHYHYPPPHEFTVRGIICNRKITEEFVRCYALIVHIRGHVDPTAIFSVIAYDHAGNKIKDIFQGPPFRVPIEPGLFLFQNMTLPNNYEGYIGRFFIKATFYDT